LKKRITIIVVLILIAAIAASLIFLAHRNKCGDVSNVKRTVTASKIYSEQDINDAMDIVAKFFQSDFEGCTLTDLWYEERISVPASDGWAKQYNADESIVLLSNFDVNSSGGDGSLNPNTTYPNWQWILVRSKGSEWELKTWGY
jgi:uncharacterized membrane protein